MNPDSLSIPISADTGCCSETAVDTGSLPVVSDMPTECCASSQPAATQTQVDGAHVHGESCSHHPPSTVVEASQAVGVSEESKVATNDEWTPPGDADLIDALREVIDPELMINIVDLGLVYSINQTDRKVVVEMTLTSPACPAGPQIISQAKMSLEKLAGVDAAEIKLTMSPPWTPDRMTDDARDQLGIF